MKTTPIRIAAALAACIITACSADVASPSASTLNGSWARLDQVPGSSERWNLTVQGSAITGDGTWSGEACCAGSLTLSGTIAGDSIHVDVVLTDAIGPAAPRTIHEHFDGALTTRTLLEGKGAYDGGQASDERLRKQ